jgi:hypothetical protein
MAGDFRALGFARPQELAGQDALALYRRLCVLTGARIDGFEQAPGVLAKAPAGGNDEVLTRPRHATPRQKENVMNLLARAALLALTLSLPVACAPVEDDTAATWDADAVSLRSGVSVDARYRHAFVGTPTYGSAQTPFLTVAVSVDDVAIRRAHPGFNGFEAPFVRVPRTVDGRVVWESVALRYTGTFTAGYYGQERRDRYELAASRAIDLATVQRLGVAVGLETNVGTLWAQEPGQNFAVRPADAR